MFHLARKFAPLGWNRRVFTEADFDRLCRRERIRVCEIPLSVGGFYMRARGRQFIYLDSRLRGVRRLRAALHELGHYYLHAGAEPTSAFFYGLRPDAREEFEADAFAAVAMIPEPLLRRLLAWEIEEEYGYARDLINFRLKVLDTYGI
jgi:Zn-dependent peptidase ImmA (M78 family)